MMIHHLKGPKVTIVRVIVKIFCRLPILDLCCCFLDLMQIEWSCRNMTKSFSVIMDNGHVMTFYKNIPNNCPIWADEPTMAKTELLYPKNVGA